MTAEKISAQQQRVMSGAAEKASSTGSSAGAFGATVSHLSSAPLRAGPLQVQGGMDSASDRALQMRRK